MRTTRVRALARLIMCAALAGCIQGEPPAPALRAPGDPERGALVIDALGCGTCHVIPGIKDARATVGPPLTDWASRTYIAGAIANTPQNLTLWIRNPQAVEPGTAMPTMAMTDADARDMAAYLFKVGRANAPGPPHLIPLSWLRRFGKWAE